ncbi:MAG: 16S rRNA (uracil(1498)-N(3))-methyltransferase [Dehalococcoidia bacterium]|nr:16S rRNA (uracil(1498)-N(3))-methyltransferase [Dehalococcoidia bacterium]
MAGLYSRESGYDGAMAHVPRLFVRGHLGPGPLLIEGEQAQRLTKVMRLREGEKFLAFSGDGREWEATVGPAAKSGLHAAIGAFARQEPAPAVTLELWVALVRPNRFDWAVEKATEAGADVIRPLLSEHSARGEGSSAGRQERWERIAIEAAEQCGRLYMPVIEPPAHFNDLLGRHHGALVVADMGGRPWEEVSALLPDEGRLAVAIGPEGGFSQEEVARARAHGALVARLGPNTLRSETAAVVAVALVRSLGR